MPKIPQFEFEEKLSGSSLPYESRVVDSNLFGNLQSNSFKQFASGINKLNNSVQVLKTNEDELRVLEAYNSLNDWCQDNLYDTENGYFQKMGKDALIQYNPLTSSLNKHVLDLKKIYKISPESQNIFNKVIGTKKSKILEQINNYNEYQVNVWKDDVIAETLNNSITNFVQSRNSEESMAQNIKTISNILYWIKNNDNLSEDDFENLKNETFSKMNISILDAYINEGSLKAKEYFVKNKNNINPELNNIYNDKINQLEFNYNVNSLSNKILAYSSDYTEAAKEINNIKDETLAEYVNSKVKAHFFEIDNINKQKNKKYLEDFYLNHKVNKFISYMDIPKELNNDDKLSLMNFINKNGNPNTDNVIFFHLFKTMSENSKDFANMDLNKIRGYLSNDVYEVFLKKQQAINESYASSTQLKDDYMLINRALNSLNLTNSVPPDFLKVKNKVREYESKTGNNIPYEVLNKVFLDVGLKSSYLDKYKQIENDLIEKMEFICDIFNDFESCQFDGTKLSLDEKEKLVLKRVKRYKALNK